MIRDVFTPTTPFVMRSEMYALAAIMGVMVVRKFNDEA